MKCSFGFLPYDIKTTGPLTIGGPVHNTWQTIRKHYSQEGVDTLSCRCGILDIVFCVELTAPVLLETSYSVEWTAKTHIWCVSLSRSVDRTQSVLDFLLFSDCDTEAIREGPSTPTLNSQFFTLILLNKNEKLSTYSCKSQVCACAVLSRFLNEHSVASYPLI